MLTRLLLTASLCLFGLVGCAHKCCKPPCPAPCPPGGVISNAPPAVLPGAPPCNTCRKF